MKQIYLYWLLGLLGLAGRYDFSGDGFNFALRSFILSALLFIALITFVGIRLNSHWIKVPLTVILCLPYHFLTLDHHFYHLKIPVLHHWESPNTPLPKLDWFPGAWQSLPAIPYELPFFLTLTGLLTTSFFFLSKRWKLKSSEFRLGILVILLISLQTWLHLSLRSPYTYVPHFEGPSKDHYWFHYYLFPNQKGAVNLDYLAFRVGEELFFGTKNLSNPIITRAFPTYIASQFTAFFNPLYVWLSLNIAFWFMSATAIFLLAKHFFDEKTALFSSLLMASNQSLILYVGQPKVYTMAICLLAIVLLSQIKLLSKVTLKKIDLISFGLLIFFFLLSYEAHPWIIGFFCFAYVTKTNLKATSLALLLGVLSYYLFLNIASHLPELKTVNTLADNAGNPSQNILNLFTSGASGGNLWKIFVKSLMSLRGFGRSLVHCFQWCILPAAFGLCLISKKQRVIQVSLLIAPFLTYAYFEMGDNWLYTRFPRLVMLAYPAIFMLAGAGLARLQKRSNFLAWGFVVLNFIYLNLDVWGHPWIYYLWFYKNPGHSLAP